MVKKNGRPGRVVPEAAVRAFPAGRGYRLAEAWGKAASSAGNEGYGLRGWKRSGGGGPGMETRR